MSTPSKTISLVQAQFNEDSKDEAKSLSCELVGKLFFGSGSGDVLIETFVYHFLADLVPVVGGFTLLVRTFMIYDRARSCVRKSDCCTKTVLCFPCQSFFFGYAAPILCTCSFWGIPCLIFVLHGIAYYSYGKDFDIPLPCSQIRKFLSKPNSEVSEPTENTNFVH